MRIWAVSDLHIDYAGNARWVAELSTWDFRNDILILAGDVSDRLSLLGWCLSTLSGRFRKVLYVTGNHELWVLREGPTATSLQKYQEVVRIAGLSGASMQAFHSEMLSIIPVPGWYDYSFGAPSRQLLAMWMDYRACRWPAQLQTADIAAHFLALGPSEPGAAGNQVITFSHFVPRIELVRRCTLGGWSLLDPVLGSMLIEQRLRHLGATLHVYGHSHVNSSAVIDGVRYVNNAFGYPSESGMTAKRLLCIHEC